MEIKCETKESTGFITLSGALTAGVVDLLHDQFNNWYSDENAFSNLIVDMAGVESMDSSGLGALIGIMKKVAENDVEMKIAALQDKTRLVFEITRAYKIFDIFDTVDEAVGACA